MGFLDDVENEEGLGDGSSLGEIADFNLFDQKNQRGRMSTSMRLAREESRLVDALAEDLAVDDDNDEMYTALTNHQWHSAYGTLSDKDRARLEVFRTIVSNPAVQTGLGAMAWVGRQFERAERPIGTFFRGTMENLQLKSDARNLGVSSTEMSTIRAYLKAMDNPDKGPAQQMYKQLSDRARLAVDRIPQEYRAAVGMPWWDRIRQGFQVDEDALTIGQSLLSPDVRARIDAADVLNQDIPLINRSLNDSAFINATGRMAHALGVKMSDGAVFGLDMTVSPWNIAGTGPKAMSMARLARNARSGAPVVARRGTRAVLPVGPAERTTDTAQTTMKLLNERGTETWYNQYSKSYDKHTKRLMEEMEREGFSVPGAADETLPRKKVQSTVDRRVTEQIDEQMEALNQGVQIDPKTAEKALDSTARNTRQQFNDALAELDMVEASKQQAMIEADRLATIDAADAVYRMNEAALAQGGLYLKATLAGLWDIPGIPSVRVPFTDIPGRLFRKTGIGKRIEQSDVFQSIDSFFNPLTREQRKFAGLTFEVANARTTRTRIHTQISNFIEKTYGSMPEEAAELVGDVLMYRDALVRRARRLGFEDSRTAKDVQNMSGLMTHPQMVELHVGLNRSMQALAEKYPQYTAVPDEVPMLLQNPITSAEVYKGIISKDLKGVDYWPSRYDGMEKHREAISEAFERDYGEPLSQNMIEQSYQMQREFDNPDDAVAWAAELGVEVKRIRDFRKAWKLRGEEFAENISRVNFMDGLIKRFGVDKQQMHLHLMGKLLPEAPSGTGKPARVSEAYDAAFPGRLSDDAKSYLDQIEGLEYGDEYARPFKEDDLIYPVGSFRRMIADPDGALGTAGEVLEDGSRIIKQDHHNAADGLIKMLDDGGHRWLNITELPWGDRFKLVLRRDRNAQKTFTNGHMLEGNTDIAVGLDASGNWRISLSSHAGPREILEGIIRSYMHKDSPIYLGRVQGEDLFRALQNEARRIRMKVIGRSKRNLGSDGEVISKAIMPKTHDPDISDVGGMNPDLEEYIWSKIYTSYPAEDEAFDIRPLERLEDVERELSEIDEVNGLINGVGEDISEHLIPFVDKLQRAREQKSSRKTVVEARRNLTNHFDKLDEQEKSVFIRAAMRYFQEDDNPEGAIEFLAAFRDRMDQISDKDWHDAHKTIRYARHGYSPDTDNFGRRLVLVEEGIGAGSYVPATVMDLLKIANGHPDPKIRKGVKNMVRVYDLLLDSWKFSVTSPFVPFHMRNHVSNILQAMLEIGLAAIDPVNTVRTLRLLMSKDYGKGIFGKSLDAVTRHKLRDGYIDVLGDKVPLDEIRREMDVFGVIQEKSVGERDIVSTLTAEGKIEKIHPKSWAYNKPAVNKNPRSWAKALLYPFHAGPAVGNIVENWSRAFLYARYRSRGVMPQMAAQAVDKVFFDYDDLSGFDRIFKRLVPFWTWSKKASSLTMKQIRDNPGKMRALVRLENTLRADDKNEIGPDEAFLPEYVMGALKLGWHDDGKAKFLVGADTPLDSVFQMFYPAAKLALGQQPSQSEFEQALRKWQSSLIPGMAPINAWGYGTDPFTGGDVSPYARKRNEGAADVVKAASKFVDRFIPGMSADEFLEWMEYREEEDPKTGQLFRTMNAAKFYIFIQGTGISRFVSTSDKFRRYLDKEGPETSGLLLSAMLTSIPALAYAAPLGMIFDPQGTVEQLGDTKRVLTDKDLADAASKVALMLREYNYDLSDRQVEMMKANIRLLGQYAVRRGVYYEYTTFTKSKRERVKQAREDK